MLNITSLQNPKVKDILHLRDKSTRDETGLFLIEGYRELFRAVQSSWAMDSLFICPELFLGSNENALIQEISKTAKVFSCDKKVFQKISYRDRPDGLLAIAPQRKLCLDDLSHSQAPFYVIAEAIEKPGNLGTILRSADAAGADGLIVVDPCTDIFNPNVVRASVGTLFTIPVVTVTSAEALSWLNAKGISVLAATPHAVLSYTEVDLKQPVAIALGTEQLGLSSLWMEQANLQVKIPMFGIADSLNVAMATTLLLYETRRQRSLS